MAVVPVLVLLFVALWFILRGDLFYVLHCVILFLCFPALLALRLPHFGKRELILVLFVHLFDLRLFVLSVSSSSWCLGRAAVCDCGTTWTFLLPFYVILLNMYETTNTITVLTTPYFCWYSLTYRIVLKQMRQSYISVYHSTNVCYYRQSLKWDKHGVFSFDYET